MLTCLLCTHIIRIPVLNSTSRSQPGHPQLHYSSLCVLMCMPECAGGAFGGICYLVLREPSYACFEWYSKDPHEGHISSWRKLRPQPSPGFNSFDKTHTDKSAHLISSTQHILDFSILMSDIY